MEFIRQQLIHGLRLSACAADAHPPFCREAFHCRIRFIGGFFRLSCRLANVPVVKLILCEMEAGHTVSHCPPPGP